MTANSWPRSGAAKLYLCFHVKCCTVVKCHAAGDAITSECCFWSGFLATAIFGAKSASHSGQHTQRANRHGRPLTLPRTVSIAIAAEFLLSAPYSIAGRLAMDRRVLLVGGCQDCDVALSTATVCLLLSGSGNTRPCAEQAAFQVQPTLAPAIPSQLLQLREPILIFLLAGILDSNMFSGLHTTASAPSMRASEPYPVMAPPASDDSGNIKVVVRCRAFVKRGMLIARQRIGSADGSRAGEGHQMFDPHGTRHAENDAVRPERRRCQCAQGVRRQRVHI